MQETNFENMSGEMESLREHFEGNSRQELVNKMDNRLRKLESEGHKLTQRSFYTKKRKTAKVKKKLQRTAKKKNRK